jgi:hypothetical protein
MNAIPINDIIINNNNRAEDIIPPPPLVSQRTMIFGHYYNKFAEPCIQAMEEMNHYVMSVANDAPRNAIMCRELNRVLKIFKNQLQYYRNPHLSVDQLLDILMNMVNILRKVGKAMQCEYLSYAKDIPDLFPIYREL